MGNGPNIEILTAMTNLLSALKGLQPAEQKQMLDWLGKQLDIHVDKGEPLIEVGKRDKGEADSPSATKQEPVSPSPKDFMTSKRPDSAMERVACLAYYLTKHCDLKEFSKKELDKVHKDAAQSGSIRTSDISNATRVGQYLGIASPGKKMLTSRGEALVEALPDRKKVKEALKDHPIQKRRKRTLRAQKKGK